MKCKKIFAYTLSVAILSLSTTTALAANMDDISNRNLGQVEIISFDNDLMDQEVQLYYRSFTGTVKKVTDSQGENGLKYVLVENEEGIEANIVLSENTYVVNDEKIELGSTITGYYDANAMMIMIYPAQYSAEVVVVADNDQNIKVDYFDEDLISADHSLKLNISDETEILSQDGTIFTGKLTNRKLVAFYKASTRSIPAQTNPSKVVVLTDKEEASPDQDTKAEGSVVENRHPDLDKMLDGFIDNMKIEVPESIYTIIKFALRSLL